MIRKRYCCPECSGVFVYDHHPSVEADPLPDGAACPHCGFVAESEYPAAVVAPHLARPIRKTVDNMQREMEVGSQFRADVMREKYGLDPDEARMALETNMKDGLREGDTSAIPVSNSVTQVMEQAPQAFGFNGAAAAGYSQSVQTGPFPNAGLRAMEEIRSNHQSIVNASGHRTVATSSRPALETQMPGYRKRL